MRSKHCLFIFPPIILLSFQAFCNFSPFINLTISLSDRILLWSVITFTTEKTLNEKRCCWRRFPVPVLFHLRLLFLISPIGHHRIAPDSLHLWSTIPQHSSPITRRRWTAKIGGDAGYGRTWSGQPWGQNPSRKQWANHSRHLGWFGQIGQNFIRNIHPWIFSS